MPMPESKISKAVIPGSYNPITNGHIELIRRAAELFDEVTVLICINSEKKEVLDCEKKQLLVKDAIESDSKLQGKVKYDIWEGLFADYCMKHDINIVVKGIRNAADYIYESNLKIYNDKIFSEKHGKIPETIFLQSSAEWAFCSSTFVREMMKYNENIDKYVPNAKLLLSFIDSRDDMKEK